MRILWHSVAPWIKTGYGCQTAMFTRLIRELLDHEVAISSWTSAGGGIMDYNGFRIYPCPVRPGDGFGNWIVFRHARHWQADLVITLTDSWVFDPESMKRMPWVAWTPVDHDPVPPRVASTLRKGYAVPVAYSRFGQALLEDAGLSSLYVPHGCHETYFERTTRRKARDALGFPQEAFIVGMVGVNQGVPNRKSYPQCLDAFRKFNKRHQDSFLYMHTRPRTQSGLNLAHLAEHLGIEGSAYRFADEYENTLGYTESYMRDVYTAIDVLLSPNMGEGFGVPLIEAQACGTPIIGTRFSTMIELCFFGELVNGAPFYTNQSAFQRLPTVNGIYKALQAVYDYTVDDYRQGSRKARREIKKHFHPATVTRKYWDPALKQAKQRIGEWTYGETPVTGIPE